MSGFTPSVAETLSLASQALEEALEKPSGGQKRNHSAILVANAVPLHLVWDFL